MSQPRFTCSWAADFAEREALRRLRREESLNAFIESKNPGIRPTAKYLAGPLPSWHPRFGSRAEYLEYEAKRSMGKYDPFVEY